MKNRTTSAQWSYTSNTTRLVVFASVFRVCAAASFLSISAGSNGTGDPAHTVPDVANLHSPPVVRRLSDADPPRWYQPVHRSARKHVTRPRRKDVKTGHETDEALGVSVSPDTLDPDAPRPPDRAPRPSQSSRRRRRIPRASVELRTCRRERDAEARLLLLVVEPRSLARKARSQLPVRPLPPPAAGHPQHR